MENQYTPEYFEAQLNRDQIKEWEAYCISYVNAELFETCMPVFDYLFFLDPDNLAALNNKSHSLMHLSTKGNHALLDEAEGLIDRAIHLDQNFAVARLTKAEITLNRGLVSEALSLLEEMHFLEIEWTRYVHSEVLRILRDPRLDGVDIMRLHELLND